LEQNFGSDSEEHVERQLQYQRDKWHFAISQLANETLKSTENLDDDTKVKLKHACSFNTKIEKDKG
jgi:hypothetical protein